MIHLSSESGIEVKELYPDTCEEYMAEKAS
jgi:hypothetical protein